MADGQEPRPLTRGDVMTADQVAADLLPGTHPETIRRWAREGKIPSRKRGQKVFFLRWEVSDWLLGDGTRGDGRNAA